MSEDLSTSPPIASQMLPLSYREQVGDQGHTLGLYVTWVLYTARISIVNYVLCADRKRDGKF